MPRLGILSVFYVNIQTVTNPIWQAIPLVSDMTVNGDWDEGDASARQSRVKVFEPTQMDVGLSGKLRVKDGRNFQGYINLYQAWYTDNFVDVLVLNGPNNEDNAEGFRFQAKVFAWSEDQSLGTVLFKDFTIKPCIPDLPANYPKVARVVNGVLTYRDIGTGVV
jgi:hypothetical protein